MYPTNETTIMSYEYSKLQLFVYTFIIHSARDDNKHQCFILELLWYLIKPNQLCKGNLLKVYTWIKKT